MNSRRSATRPIVKVKGTEELNQRKVDSTSNKTITVRAQKKNEERKEVEGETKYAKLLEKLRGKDTLWEDPDFPADSTSVFISKRSKDYREFVWKRPKDISEDPKLFTDGVSRFDVRQGALGDCWLLAVIASLSMYEPLFKNVVPDDQDFDKNYIGAFRFRFWQFGRWCEVVVDDRIPTFRGKLVFMYSTQSNEYWSALLEKAYAKMCGTYESLNGGCQSEAMEDFTGGLCETIKLSQKDRPVDLFKQMSRFLAHSSLMGCSIETPEINGILRNGLITSHAYSVTGIEEISQTNGKRVELVRVRNPWGDEKEWKGRWCDNALEWNSVSANVKRRLCGNFENDGEFWMNFDDFVNHFTKLEVCHLGPESLDCDFDGRRRWTMSVEEGSWTKNVNAGGCRNFLETFVMNPQYKVEIVESDDNDDSDSGTIIFGLMQKDMRKRNLDLYAIGYVIYKLKDPNGGILNKSFFKFTTTVAKSPNFINQREVCGRHKLPKGHYVVIPSTFNPNEEAEYILRIFTQKPNNTTELDANSGCINIAKHLTLLDLNTEARIENLKIARLQKEIEQLFMRLCGPREVINASQLKDILNTLLKKDIKSFNGFDIEICRSMIALYDANHTGKMEFNEFLVLFKNIRIWKTAFKDFDTDGNGVFDAFEFRNALTNCGFSVSNVLFKVLANRYSDTERGIITFEDFIMSVIRLTNAFETMQLQTKNSDQSLLFEPEVFMESTLYM